MEGHLGVVHLPFESYGGTLKVGLFAWYERIGRLLYPGERPGAPARGLRALAARARVMYWRKKGASVGTREEAMGWGSKRPARGAPRERSRR